MVAERSLHDSRDFSGLQGEGGVGEGLDHLRTPETAEPAAACRGARLVGVLFDERGEIDEESYQKQLEYAKLVIVRWFAPEVGLVKEQIGSPDFTRELVAVENKGWYSDTLQTNTNEEN